MSATAPTTTDVVAPLREHYPQMAASVVAVVDVAPAYRRVRLHAPELAALVRTGPDEVVGLYLPPAGALLVMPPDGDDPRASLAALDPAVRPALRWYTVRSHDRQGATVDIDVVNSGHGGPGGEWLRRVRVGDPVGIRVLTAPYAGLPPTGRHLLVADESALPAVVAVVEHVRSLALGGRPAPDVRALVEVPDERYLHPDLVALGIEPLLRSDTPPGTQLLPALRDAPVAGYAWVCAEGSVAARARSMIVRAGTPAGAVLHCGYWCLGRPRP